MDLDVGYSVWILVFVGLFAGCWIWCKSNVQREREQCFAIEGGEKAAEPVEK